MVFPPYFIDSIFTAIKMKTLKYEFIFLIQKQPAIEQIHRDVLSPVYAINIETVFF